MTLLNAIPCEYFVTKLSQQRINQTLSNIIKHYPNILISLYPNAWTVLLQNIHAEIKSIIVIALSSYLTTPANFTIMLLSLK